MLFLLLMATLALADGTGNVAIPNVDLRLAQPSLGSSAALWTDDSGHIDGSHVVMGMGVDYLRNPLVAMYESGLREPVVSNLLALDLNLGYVVRRWRLGARLPVMLLSTGSRDADSPGLGDLGFDTRFTLLDSANTPMGLALAGRLGLPTGDVGSGMAYGAMTWEATLVADTRPGSFHIAINAGYRGLPSEDLPALTWDDQLLLRAALARFFGDDLSLSVEAVVLQDISASSGSIGGTPAEATFGFHERIVSDLLVHAGVGTALTQGIGSAVFRGTLYFTWNPEPATRRTKTSNERTAPDASPQTTPQAAPLLPEGAVGRNDTDTDKDGVTDSHDSCPRQPEDRDGYQDEDGCPDPATPVVIRLEDPDGNAIPDVQASIDGPGHFSSNESTFGLDLHPGSYHLWAASDAFFPIESDITVGGEALEIVRVMEPRPPTMARVRLKVTDPFGNPLDFALKLDANASLPVEGGEIGAMVLPGRHSFLVKADGFADKEIELEVDAGESREVELHLVPLD